MSFSQCSLPLSDLQAYGENLDLWSVPFDINYAEHMAFPKILQGTVLWVSFIISCHNDISLHRKAKLLLWEGALMKNRKKVNTVANKGHLKILFNDIDIFCLQCTTHYMSWSFVSTSRGAHMLLFLELCLFMYVIMLLLTEVWSNIFMKIRFKYTRLGNRLSKHYA